MTVPDGRSSAPSAARAVGPGGADRGSHDGAVLPGHEDHRPLGRSGVRAVRAAGSRIHAGVGAAADRAAGVGQVELGGPLVDGDRRAGRSRRWRRSSPSKVALSVSGPTCCTSGNVVRATPWRRWSPPGSRSPSETRTVRPGSGAPGGEGRGHRQGGAERRLGRRVRSRSSTWSARRGVSMPGALPGHELVALVVLQRSPGRRRSPPARRSGRRSACCPAGRVSVPVHRVESLGVLGQVDGVPGAVPGSGLGGPGHPDLLDAGRGVAHDVDANGTVARRTPSRSTPADLGRRGQRRACCRRRSGCCCCRTAGSRSRSSGAACWCTASRTGAGRR